jgi:hypothetical protein
MATLTAAEIINIRMQSGDLCEDYDVTDEYMQWIHDNLASTEPLCLSSVPHGGTIVWVIRARLAKAVALYDESGEGNAGSVSQKFDHLEKLLEKWESRCGMNGGVITIGSFDMGLDSDCETEYARFSPSHRGWIWWGAFG